MMKYWLLNHKFSNYLEHKDIFGIPVKKEMVEKITERLRYFWDLGISGPDFIWSAIGPALGSYSKYKKVRRIDGSIFNVSDFLKEVRRITTDFALGKIFHGKSTEGLDDWTRYYLMHRKNFSFFKVPAGECILLSQAYNLDLDELLNENGFLTKEGTNAIRLLNFDKRKRNNLGKQHHSGLLPYIDMLHYLLIQWENGDIKKVENYVVKNNLNENHLFWAVAQSILEMLEPESKERTLFEAIISWGKSDKIQKVDKKGKFRKLDEY